MFDLKIVKPTGICESQVLSESDNWKLVRAMCVFSRFEGYYAKYLTAPVTYYQVEKLQEKLDEINVLGENGVTALECVEEDLQKIKNKFLTHDKFKMFKEIIEGLPSDHPGKSVFHQHLEFGVLPKADFATWITHTFLLSKKKGKELFCLVIKEAPELVEIFKVSLSNHQQHMFTNIVNYSEQG